ncbi:MAG TPA: DUF4148 domain-containing protein [Ramlibacter sp.]|nr:DUF4148 domain-containing protein [Ramlibacter sp.]
MNSKAILAIAAFAALAGTAARADDITVDTTPFQSVKSRAEVQAELAQYTKAGVNPWSIRYNQLAGFQSAKTRAQVQAEYIAERDAVAALTSEDSGSAYLTQVAASRQVGTTLAGTPVNGQ